MRDSIERYARENGINNVEVTLFLSAEDLVDAFGRMRPGFFDLLFCDIGGASDDAPSEGERAIDLVRKLREDNPDLRLVLLSESKSDAIFSYDLEAGFLVMSDSYDDFVRVASGPLSAISRERSAVTIVKSTTGVENVVLADIQFVESSKRGPIIHLPHGKTVPMRGTLQMLFESLAGAESSDDGAEAGTPAGTPAGAALGRRFVKAGSSFIVNLDNVRAAGEGSLIFADGEAVIVPVRKRKALLDALRSYRMR